MKNQTIKMLLFAAVIATFSSCSTLNQTVKETNVRVELNKNDFTLSGQVSASATTTRYFGIDFERLFTQKTGTVEGGAAAISLASVPVVGTIIADQTANYALYELMNKNSGYDVIFYPTYETKIVKPIGLPIFTITTVKATARLGKLK